MNKANVYSAKGIKSGTMNLPKDFSEKENLALLAQAIRVYDARAHIGVANVKTRAEVDRTKKKVYRQKGTGGARHGARSAPIYVGGGVAHGPKGIKRELTLSKNLAKKALQIALTLKAKEGNVIVVSTLDSIKKTKDAQSLIDKIKKTAGLKIARFIFALAETNLKVRKILNNLNKVSSIPYTNLNAYEVYKGGILVIDKEVFEKTPRLRQVADAPQLWRRSGFDGQAKLPSGQRPSRAGGKNSKNPIKTKQVRKPIKK